MTKIHTQNAPDISVVKPHFLFGAIAFALAALMLILADTDLLGHYSQPRLAAVVHMMLLGWAMMLVYGSLYQLVPVVFETKLFSEPLAKITFWITGLSVFLMAYAFWVSDLTGLLVWAAWLIYTGLLLFVLNIALTYKNARLKNIKNYFIIAAIFWLFFTQTEGLLMALNFKYQFFEKPFTYHIKIHAAAGLVGFFLQMIFGVGTTLIPMFLVSHKHSEKPLWPSFILLNAGVALATLSWLYLPEKYHPYTTAAAWVMVTVAILFYVRFVWDAYRNRFKRILDEGMEPTMLIFIFIFIPVALSGWLVFSGHPSGPLAIKITGLLIFSMIFGVIALIILGQTYKTIPFIIWLEKYQPYVGKYKIPLPRELYHSKFALWQYRLYLIAVGGMFVGILIDNEWVVRLSVYLLAVVAVMYNYNMFKMFFHKPRLQPLDKK
ncbi:MAG: hypothetical protein GXO27_01445 [Chlorobi bacterium]|nr:hypothetical protein [Chlorobiota bacterium]